MFYLKLLIMVWSLVGNFFTIFFFYSWTHHYCLCSINSQSLLYVFIYSTSRGDRMTPPIKHSTGFKLKWHPVDDQVDLRRFEEDPVTDWNASQLIRLDQVHELIIYSYGDGTHIPHWKAKPCESCFAETYPVSSQSCTQGCCYNQRSKIKLWAFAIHIKELPL